MQRMQARSDKYMFWHASIEFVFSSVKTEFEKAQFVKLSCLEEEWCSQSNIIAIINGNAVLV